jgi:hypothetical protein
MPFGSKNWHRLSVQQAEAAGERWTVIWDTKRSAATDGRNTAVEKSQGAALDRARHLLRMEFIVYEIRNPEGAMVFDEAAIKQRFGIASKAVADPPRVPPRALPEFG